MPVGIGKERQLRGATRTAGVRYARHSPRWLRMTNWELDVHQVVSLVRTQPPHRQTRADSVDQALVRGEEFRFRRHGQGYIETVVERSIVRVSDLDRRNDQV